MPVAALRTWSAGDSRSGQLLLMLCPGCDDLHAVEVDPKNNPCWTWDGNLVAPTVNPSIKVEGVQWAEGDHFYKPAHAAVAAGQPITCHSFVRQGRWEFLGDSTHHLAAQTVPLPELPDHLTEGPA